MSRTSPTKDGESRSEAGEGEYRDKEPNGGVAGGAVVRRHGLQGSIRTSPPIVSPTAAPMTFRALVDRPSD
jgi:hypothetical protein